VGTLSHGKYFGELALLNEDTRQATVTAMTPGVECLVLDRGYVPCTKIKLLLFNVHGRRAHTFVIANNVKVCQYFLFTIQLLPVKSPSGMRTCILFVPDQEYCQQCYLFPLSFDFEVLTPKRSGPG
jgi:hypothetical protein